MKTSRAPKEKVTTESPELAGRFNKVLGETIQALNEAGLKYVFIGGIAASSIGRPRSTHDIDVFVRPEDAELALRALARHEFRIERTDPQWLYKGYKDNVLVDVIFKSKGEIYFDSEMNQRVTTAEYHGQIIRLVAPEDLIIIKALAHSELTPGHWHDALALLSQATIDWDYLVRRARKAPRRVLSLLLYAQSSDIHVPKNVVDQLYLVVFGDMPPMSVPHPAPPAWPVLVHPRSGSRGQSGTTGAVPAHASTHEVARLREHLAQDPRVNELDIQIDFFEGRFILRGEVTSDERRHIVERAARELFPDRPVDNQIGVARITSPGEAEEVG